ncbi:hypothetical protein D3C78_1046850 [compost metagenome]
MSNQAAHFFFDDVMQHFLNIAKQLRRLYVLLLKMGHCLIVDGINSILTSMLLGNLYSFNKASFCKFTNFAVYSFINGVKYNLHFLLARNRHKFFDNSYDFLDFVMSKHNGLKHYLFRHFVCFSFHHHNSIFCTRHYDINVAGFLLGNVRINDKLTVNASDRHAANRSIKRYI